MRNNQVDLPYQHALKYGHHAKYYKESILEDITPFGLRLKKKAAINPRSPDFNIEWNGILKDAERKLLKLLLKGVQDISRNADKELKESIEKEHPNNYVKEKELVEKRNSKFKKILEERRKKKWQKFRIQPHVLSNRKSKNVLVSDFVENALNRNNSKEQNDTPSRTRKKTLRRRAMIFTNSGIPLLTNNNNRESINDSINGKDHNMLDNELAENQIDSISSTVGSTADNLLNGSIVAEMKTSETQSTFHDSILGNSDLSLLEILQSLQNESGSVSEALVPPSVCTSTAGLVNTSVSTSIVEDVAESTVNMTSNTQEAPIIRTDENGSLKRYFCSDVVFNLSHKVLSDLEIGVLNEGLGFSPTPTFTNEADLRRYFTEFARKMRCKCYFRNDATEDFSEVPAFRVKSNWNPPKGHPALEMFLSQAEGEIFSLLPGNSTSYNLTKEEWKAMRGLAEDRSIVIKPADKGSCVVVWDKIDYLVEAENNLSDNST